MQGKASAAFVNGAVIAACVAAALALWAGTASAQSVEDRVEAYITAAMQKRKIPGVALAVIDRGKPIIVKGYGLANIEHGVPVKPETIFQSGSVGKQFTAAAVMLLVEDGKIGLDDGLSKYFSDVPDAWKGITVRHLLTHTSGMGDYPSGFDFRRDFDDAFILKTIRETPLIFPQGQRWYYSNLGYVTLGLIIRKASGKFYGDFLDERIFKPLGMTTARVISESDIVPNRAAGYELKNGNIKNQDWVSPSVNSTADGALYLSLLDMIKWEEALANGKLLSRRSLTEVWKPVTLADGKPHPYGFGWNVTTVNGRRLIEHGGAWQGFKAFIARYPDDGLTVILFANLANMDPARLAHAVAAIARPELAPVFPKDAEPKVTAEHKLLLERVVSGVAARGIFSDELQKALFDGSDRVLTFAKRQGEIESFRLIGRSRKEARASHRYQVEYGEVTFALEIEEAGGKIVMFGLQPG